MIISNQINLINIYSQNTYKNDLYHYNHDLTIYKNSSSKCTRQSANI